MWQPCKRASWNFRFKYLLFFKLCIKIEKFHYVLSFFQVRRTWCVHVKRSPPGTTPPTGGHGRGAASGKHILLLSYFNSIAYLFKINKHACQVFLHGQLLGVSVIDTLTIKLFSYILKLGGLGKLSVEMLEKHEETWGRCTTRVRWSSRLVEPG